MAQYEFLYQGSFAMLKVQLAARESLKAESGAMVAMSETIDVEGKMEGGVLGGLSRMVAGEKFFFQTLTATRGPGQVLLAPSILGSIYQLDVTPSSPYTIQKDGFLAGSESLEISTKMQNLTKGVLSGEGFFVINVSGSGTLFVSSFGAIHEVAIPAGESFVIDNSHLVAWPANTEYKIEKASAGWISAITSGEAIVCRFKGPAKVLIQSRNPRGFGEWIKHFIPLRRS